MLHPKPKYLLSTICNFMQKHIIDANGKSLGRVASEAAKVLLGKYEPKAKAHLVSSGGVSVVNVDKILMSDKKQQEKTYLRYSGYPGGKKEETLKKIIVTKGKKEVLKKAVSGMLPRNRLLKLRLENLSIS